MMDKLNQKEPTQDDDANDASGSDEDVPVARTFTMAHALSMIRKRNEQQNQAKQEEEKQLENERREKAREKARRRRQNQKLAKAKLREAKSKSDTGKLPGAITNDTCDLVEKDKDTCGEHIEPDNGSDITHDGREWSSDQPTISASTSSRIIDEDGQKGSLKRANLLIPRALLIKKRPK